jgi:molybdate transport system substrate-binding protein
MSRSRRQVVGLTLAGLLAMFAAACSSSSGSTGTSPSASSTGLSGNLTVSAASSLTDVFTSLGDQFMSENPGVKITFNFASSSDLAEQIVQGAPVDVFASASDSTMQTVVDAGDAGDPTKFARNSLEIATPPSNPADVSSLNDLAKSSVSVAVCTPDAPCGAATQTLFANNKLKVTPVTLEPDVRSVLTKVTADEVDAGVVYITDVQAAGSDVHGVTIPPPQNVSTDYLIAALSGAGNSSAADAWVAFVLSPTGQKALQQAGFAKP